MNLRTEIDIRRSDFSITHSMRGLFVGSCFSENIFSRMERAKFFVSKNPYGISFNPASIAAVLRDVAKERFFLENDLIESGGLWCSLSHHGMFSGEDKEIVLKNINAAAVSATHELQRADYIVITFGTAWVYRHTATDTVANNCHKIPQTEFSREKLSVDEIVAEFDELMSLPAFSEKRFIFTISPVRHLRDGAFENQVSKSTLFLSVHELLRRHPRAIYFPAYELVMDDLRDYRFYDTDMVHPSPQAVDYIYEKFSAAFFDDQTAGIAARAEQITTAAAHRPLNPDTAAHRKFKAAMMQKIEELETKIPETDFSKEKKIFSE